MCSRMYPTRIAAITTMMAITQRVDQALPLLAVCSTITLRLTYSSSSFGGGCMLECGSKGGATAHDQTGREEEEGEGEAGEGRGGEEAAAQPVVCADHADGQRAGADAGIEGPDDAAEGPGPACSVGVGQDERHECGVGTAEADAEDGRGDDHLPRPRGEGEHDERHRDEQERGIKDDPVAEAVTEVRGEDAHEDVGDGEDGEEDRDGIDVQLPREDGRIAGDAAISERQHRERPAHDV